MYPYISKPHACMALFAPQHK